MRGNEVAGSCAKRGIGLILTAPVQLGIAVTITHTLLTGFIAMLALAGGLAFGLGGKDHAARVLDDLRESIDD